MIDFRRACFLALDYSLTGFSVAVFNDGRLIGSLKQTVKQSQNSSLMLAVAKLLSRSGIKKEQLACLVSTAGPGSFTAMRISLATVYALSQGLRIPVYTSDALSLVAYAQANGG